MENETFSVEYKRLKLSEEDILIIKVDVAGLSEENSLERVKSIRDDEFVKYIESMGNKVIVSYSGIDFQVLRLNENDKLVVYADVSSMDEQQSTEYESLVSNKIGQVVENEIVFVPVKNGSPVLKVKNGDANE